MTGDVGIGIAQFFLPFLLNLIFGAAWWRALSAAGCWLCYRCFGLLRLKYIPAGQRPYTASRITVAG
jgi:hypothetical protein